MAGHLRSQVREALERAGVTVLLRPIPYNGYELTLLRHVEPAQAWGVTAAASAGTRPAVKNAWLPTGPDGTWVINSIGVISHAGQTLLIAVLSGNQPSESEGIRQVQGAAIAAAAAITARVP